MTTKSTSVAVKAAGHSTTKGFTPQGEKHLSVRDFSDYLVCFLSGGSITRPTITHVRADGIAKAIRIAHQKGVRLTGPGGIDSDLTKPAEVPVKLALKQPLPPNPASEWTGNVGKPIVHVGTGYLYQSVQAAADAFAIGRQNIDHCLKGHSRSANGHVFRYATQEEIKARKVLVQSPEKSR